MRNIPEFFDNYHLPDGVYECTIEEIEHRFLFSKKRVYVWGLFKKLLDRLISLGLKPKTILIDGSFVTAREEPGDVDFAALIPPETVITALADIKDDHDKQGIYLFANPNNADAIRSLFGSHFLIAENEEYLNAWANFFQKGGNHGRLRDRDPERDPEWVIIPRSKGILKVHLDGGDFK
ncbi:hypothetical protein V3851_18340 [Paenibacillus sp. M1]|uniref:Uncharacterized protein n=1 Tax=Paenibacillus haidiansis TaxID=1574488 RepID=A0ABU7VVL6_9BACL